MLVSMVVTVTEVMPYDGRGLGRALGIEHETDRVVKFRADWRTLDHTRALLSEGNDVDLVLEAWQVEHALP